MKIQLVSDTHLELRDGLVDWMPNIQNHNNETDVLCLCGDIGYPHEYTYHKFLNEMQKRFKLVLVIAGNHEFYDSTPYYKKEELINEVCNKLNQRTNNLNEFDDKIINLDDQKGQIYFLEQNVLELDDYIILGTILWTDTVKCNEVSKTLIKIKMTDYQEIHMSKNQLITPKETTSLHHQKSKWLEESIAKYKQSRPHKKIIVLSHHAPSHKCVNEYSDHASGLWEPAFCSNQEHLFKDIDLWCYGHTHDTTDLSIIGAGATIATRVVSNPFGYPDEGLEYDKQFVIDI